ncbi:hypothetical protein BCR36DRAFT_375511 [Piromyces finnis]|uniref:Ion transport domain-containing protein n=1 Tax=Piromyces finnis TaxID=1754191 RepID=A0A1Y1UQM6_9FUNG|nr:hypothetical protein BCR36DRAFT_375511 [Piromyces finnis]|eukprot:ORX40353.1 hypothetical protein BCR36DRAFT_375511 [Piromyces finnis]
MNKNIKRKLLGLQDLCYKIVENKYFSIFSITLIFLNLLIVVYSSNDSVVEKKGFYEYLISFDKIFCVYFIFEAIVSIISRIRISQIFSKFETYYDLLVITGYEELIVFLGLLKSPYQLFEILQFLHCFFLYDENQICSTSNSRGYQCPSGFTCTKTDYNPYYNTVGFDNIFYAFLSIFQIITKVGWGEMLYMTSDGTNYFGSFYYILVITLEIGLYYNSLLVFFSNNLVDEIEEEYRVSSQQLIKKSIENFKIIITKFPL